MKGEEVTTGIYDNVIIPVISYLSSTLGPRLSKMKMKGQNIASSAMRHVRKTTHSITLSSVDDEELAALEIDVRNCISLVQQERRRRTVAEFSASRDALNRTSTDGLPLSPSSSAFTGEGTVILLTEGRLPFYFVSCS
jgi:hypothetical protein